MWTPEAIGAAMLLPGVAGVQSRWLDEGLYGVGTGVRAAADGALETFGETAGSAGAVLVTTFATQVASGVPPDEAWAAAQTAAMDTIDPKKIALSFGLNTAGGIAEGAAYQSAADRGLIPGVAPQSATAPAGPTTDPSVGPSDGAPGGPASGPNRGGTSADPAPDNPVFGLTAGDGGTSPTQGTPGSPPENPELGLTAGSTDPGPAGSQPTDPGPAGPRPAGDTPPPSTSAQPASTASGPPASTPYASPASGPPASSPYARPASGPPASSPYAQPASSPTADPAYTPNMEDTLPPTGVQLPATDPTSPDDAPTDPAIALPDRRDPDNETTDPGIPQPDRTSSDEESGTSPHRTKDEEWKNYLINRPGFKWDPDFGQQLADAVAEADRAISSGQLTSLDDLLTFLAGKRQDVAIDLNDPDAGLFGTRRSIPDPEQTSATPLSGRYRYAFPRARPIRVTLPDGTELRLTELLFDSETGQLSWRHTSAEHIPAILSHAGDLYDQALDPNLPLDRTLEIVAELHWWLCQAMPYYRGSAAISDMVIKTIFKQRGIEVGPWAEGVAADIEALVTTDPETYARLFPTLFETPPRFADEP
jgi:hypothetical protein